MRLDDQMLVACTFKYDGMNATIPTPLLFSNLTFNSTVSIPRLHLRNTLDLDDSTRSRKVSSLDTGSGRRVGRKELKRER